MPLLPCQLLHAGHRGRGRKEPGPLCGCLSLSLDEHSRRGACRYQRWSLAGRRDRGSVSPLLDPRLDPSFFRRGDPFHSASDPLDWNDLFPQQLDGAYPSGHGHPLLLPVLFPRNDLACGGQADTPSFGGDRRRGRKDLCPLRARFDPRYL